MKPTIIIKEAARSFYRHIFTNILLMAQFAVCFFLLMTIGTYYFEIGDTKEVNFIESFGEREWYIVRIDSNASWDNVTSIAQEEDGLERASAFYEGLSDSDLFEFICYRDGQSVSLDSKRMDQKFGAEQYNDFIDYGGDFGKPTLSSAYVEEEDDGEEYLSVYLKSVQMNLEAYELFEIGTSEGEGFTAENLRLDDPDSYVPILLGSEYQEAFEVGEIVRMQMPTMGSEDWYFNCRVAGILESDACMPMYSAGDNLIYLDNYIVFPTGITINYVPEDRNTIAKYTSAFYSDAIEYSAISINEGYEYRDVISYATELSEEYEMYPLLFTSTSFGMDILKNETKTTITIITTLSITLLCFTLFLLFSSCITRIEQNTRTYAIYLMTGASINDIKTAYLIEMMILFVPATMINYMILSEKMDWTMNYAPLLVILGAELLVFLSAAIVIHRKIGGINMEELMRRKE